MLSSIFSSVGVMLTSSSTEVNQIELTGGHVVGGPVARWPGGWQVGLYKDDNFGLEQNILAGCERI